MDVRSKTSIGIIAAIIVGVILVVVLSLWAAPAQTDGPVVEQAEPGQAFADQDTDVTLTGRGFGLETSILLGEGGPFLAGSYNTPGNAHSVAISGDYAYIADGGSGIQVIDKFLFAPAMKKYHPVQAQLPTEPFVVGPGGADSHDMEFNLGA